MSEQSVERGKQASSPPLEGVGARVIFAVAAPPLAWSVQEIASMYVAFGLCLRGMPSTARGLLLVISAVALMVTVVAGLLGYGRWRRLAAAASAAPKDSPAGRGMSGQEMLALASVFLGLVFTLAVVWTGLPALLLNDVCGAER